MLLTDVAWSSLMPALSASDGQIWLIGTAPLPTSEVLRRYAVRGRAGKDKDLAYFEWAAPLDAVPSDIDAIAQANPALGRLRLDWVMEELRGMRPEDYGREVLGWWREDETPSPFPAGSWDALTYQGHLEVDGAPCFAVDVTPMRDHSTIAVAANTDAGRPLVEIVETQRGTSWVVPKIWEVLKGYPGTKVIVDRAGWSASLADDIRAADIAVHDTDAAEVSTAAGQFLEAVIEQKFFHRGDPRLTTAVEGARQRPIGERWGLGSEDALDRRVALGRFIARPVGSRDAQTGTRVQGSLMAKPQYRWAHQQKRKQMLPLAYGKACIYCGLLMAEYMKLDLDHTTDRITHATCNRSAGARYGNASVDCAGATARSIERKEGREWQRTWM